MPARKKAAKKNRKANRKTGRKKSPPKGLSAKELDQWMMCFSHEFRTPLNSILTFSDMMISMNDGSMDGESLEFLSLIHTDGMRLLRLVEKTTLLIDLEQGKAVFYSKPVSLPETFNLVVEAMGSSDLKSVLKTGFPQKLDVQADRLKLENLLKEILENAAVHGEQGKPITVAAKSSGRTVEMKVANSMPAEHKADPKKVFAKFIQGNMGDLTSKPPGMGVGLAICRHIAKAFRGKITCKRPSKGKWVTTISLPKASYGGG
ncbi:MAG: HAMP domain-containing sensor histidine kinase [Nitrospinota bacterium]